MKELLVLMGLLGPLSLMTAAFAFGRASARTKELKPIEWSAWIGVTTAAAAAIAVAFHGPLTTTTFGIGGTLDGLGLAFRFDALSVTIFGMVALLAIPLLRFSRTYLDGEPRRHHFMRLMAMTIASVQILVLAGNLLLFAATWVATSALLHRLLLFYPERRGAQSAARKKFIVARISEVLLLGAAGLIYSHVGTGDIGAIISFAQEEPESFTTAAWLLAAAAVTKSAQFPLHGWLLEVMETPTPVSALLHAGILNAGPYLICRFAGVFETSVGATAFVVVAGAATALFASIALTTQPAVKTSLTYSSAAHMGFSLMLCGFGVYAAAVLHLVGHSFYKAHAFLTTGSAVDAGAKRAPERSHHPVKMLVGVASALAIYAGLAAALQIDVASQPGLFALGAVVVMGLSQLLAPAFDSAVSWRVVARCAALGAVVAAAFFAFETGSQLLLGSAIPAAEATGVRHALAIAVVVLFAFVTTLQITRPQRLRRASAHAWVHLRNGLYVSSFIDRITRRYATSQGHTR